MIAMARDGVRQRRQLRRLTRHEIASRYRTLTAEGAPGPPEASDVRADDGGGPWPPLPPGGRGRHRRKVLDDLDGLR